MMGRKKEEPKSKGEYWTCSESEFSKDRMNQILKFSQNDDF